MAWFQIAVATLSGSSLRDKLFTPIVRFVPLFTKQRNGSSPLKGCEDNSFCKEVLTYELSFYATLWNGYDTIRREMLF